MFNSLLNKLQQVARHKLRHRSISLKEKLIMLSVGLCTCFVWILVFFSATILQSQFQQVILDRQFASAQRFAADIDANLTERIDNLNEAAAKLPVNLETTALRAYLAQLHHLHKDFSGGMKVIGLDGKVIADTPVFPQRQGVDYKDRDYFRNVVVTQKPFIGKPLIGRTLKEPVLIISVPVFDRTGKLQAVMTGGIKLITSHFLDALSHRAILGKNDFVVVSLRDNLILSATDPKRVFTAPPARGTNPVFDQFVTGFNGSGIAADQDGQTTFYSAMHVPNTNWLAMTTLPAKLAFAPLQRVRVYLYAAAIIMTLLTIGSIGWVTRRMLAPLDHAGKAMRQMTLDRTQFMPLPVQRDDEIGDLINNFNLLVQDRQRYEAALTESQELVRKLAIHQEKIKENERKNIAREIHDELGQTLLVLRLDASMLHARTAKTHPKLHKKVSLSLSHIDATIKSIRSLMNNLRPAVLDLGLHAVIEWQAQEFQRKTGITCTLHINNKQVDCDTSDIQNSWDNWDNWDTDLDENTALILFRIVQESLNNVVQHAQASQVHITVNKDPHQLEISVADNGIGIQPDCREQTNAFGLLGIRERLAALKGTLVLSSALNQGTSLSFSIPLPVLPS